jgi:hypothetical protein
MNYTEEQKKSHLRYSQKVYNQKPENKKRNNERMKKFRRENPERAREIDRNFYYEHRSERIAATTRGNNKPCRDPVLNDTVRYNTLIARIRYHPELYEGVVPKDCIIHTPKIKGLELLSDEQRKQLEEN